MRRLRFGVGSALALLLSAALGTQTVPLAAAAAQRALELRIVPASPTEVGNCIPFGNNTDYGFSGFIYRNVRPFHMHVGDRIAFDLGALDDVRVQRNIYFSLANKNPHRAQVSGGNVVSQGVAATSWVQVVSDGYSPTGRPRGDTIVGNYELRYVAEADFDFPGGALIVGVGSTPPGNYVDSGCEQVLVQTTSNDASGHFYARFCLKDDQTLAVLDEAGLCGGTASAIGGIVIGTL